MTPEVEDSYYFLINSRASSGPLFGQVSKVVDAAAKERKLRLRPDGALFLISNLTDLVVAPLFNAGHKHWFNGDLLSSEFQKLLAEDVGAILSESERVAMTRGRNYISSTSVLYATSTLLADLKINQLQLWGPKQKTTATQR